MHIQRNKREYKGKVYTSVLLRQCYYENGKIKQRTIANLSRMPKWLIRTIELAIKKDELNYKLEDLEFEDAYSFGDIYSLWEIIEKTGLGKIIYSKRIKERELVVGMIIGRILHPSSKLENVRWIGQRKEAFSEVLSLNYEKLEVDDLYEALDWLERSKGRIEKKLWRANGKPKLFLYDITSVYFEGEKAEGGEYGYNRDKKKGKKQVVIGLMMDEEGYPVSVEVFNGKTSDQSTVKDKVEEIKKKYGIEKAILIGDRGMITSARMDEIEKEGFSFITCLTHKRIKGLIEDSSTPFQIGLFDERFSVEIEYGGRRYILCKNPLREKEERSTLASLIRKTKNELNRIKNMVKRGRLKDEKKIAERVGRWKNRYKAGRYFEVEIKEGEFNFWLNKEELEIEKRLLGCYVVVTNVSKKVMGKDEVVERYKELSLVDRAFRVIKTTLLNIHPVYHWKERRIRAHTFICMLAYWIVLKMKKDLKPLFEGNGKGKEYEFTFENVLSELNQIKIGRIRIKDMEIRQLSKLTETQKRILNLLRVNLRVKKEVTH